MKIKYICLLLGFLLQTSVLFGQINIKVGYGFGYTPAGGVNNIINSFNDALAADPQYDIESAIPELHFMHGILFGARWKYNLFAIDFSWENLGRSREGFGGFGNDATFFLNEYTFRSNNVSVSLESEFEGVALGFGIGAKKFTIKKPFEGSTRSNTLFSDNEYNLLTYLSFNLGGTKLLSFVLRPFVTIPLGRYNIADSQFAQEFTGVIDIDPNLDEALWTYGITLIFYNGFQNK